MEISDLQFRAPSAKWVNDRSTYLGGTDIAAIMQLHPYKTELSVYLEKKGMTTPIELNQAMVHGQNLELYVAQCYRAATGRQIHKSKFYRDKKYPCFAANPDYEIRGEKPSRLLECKTAGYFAGQIFGDEGDAVPDQYLCQCMWQLAITGRQVCDLGVLIGGQNFRIYTIERDEELIKTLRERAQTWWETYILQDNAPPISGHQVDSEIVKNQFPESNTDLVYATAEIDDAAILLANTKALASETKLEQTRLENVIKQHMGEAGLLKTSVGDITWKSTKNGQRRFCADIKEIVKCQAVA